MMLVVQIGGSLFRTRKRERMAPLKKPLKGPTVLAEKEATDPQPVIESHEKPLEDEAPLDEAPVERVPLGRLLVDAGFLTRQQLDDCLFEGSKTGERIGEVVVRRGLASEDDVARLLAEQWGLDYVERSAIWFDGNALARFRKRTRSAGRPCRPASRAAASSSRSPSPPSSGSPPVRDRSARRRCCRRPEVRARRRPTQRRCSRAAEAASSTPASPSLSRRRRSLPPPSTQSPSTRRSFRRRRSSQPFRPLPITRVVEPEPDPEPEPELRRPRAARPASPKCSRIRPPRATKTPKPTPSALAPKPSAVAERLAAQAAAVRARPRAARGLRAQTEAYECGLPSSSRSRGAAAPGRESCASGFACALLDSLSLE